MARRDGGYRNLRTTCVYELLPEMRKNSQTDSEWYSKAPGRGDEGDRGMVVLSEQVEQYTSLLRDFDGSDACDRRYEFSWYNLKTLLLIFLVKVVNSCTEGNNPISVLCYHITC